MTTFSPKRVYGESVAIDYTSTKDFFEERGARALSQEIGILNATMYQDKEPELAAERDRYEKAAVFPLFVLNKETKVLDLGCGTGRWGFSLAPYVATYLGVDFSAALIRLAQQTLLKGPDPGNLHFQNISALEIGCRELLVPPPFHLFIIGGLMAYLNDEDCYTLLSLIPPLASPSSLVYIREPIAIRTRLTLAGYFSEELNSLYSAIYRTEDEYLSIFAETLGAKGFKLIRHQILFPKELCNRKDTTQKIFLFKKEKED
ncbi:MAG: class I SAM-dependent methyltransferase [Desulfobaccales bacterium]